MLKGLKVVEVATYVAAPGAGGMLADWGAEVIKIEGPGGDPIRGFFASIGAETPDNPVFELDNRGKRGLALDLSKPEGLALLDQLVAKADVFLTNLRPGALGRAKLDPERLRSLNPRLVYASVTGFGLTGPDADKPGLDVAAFWSRAGVAALTTPKGSEPFLLRTAVGDHTCSLATVSAILAALLERERTGEGRLVETSLLKSGVYSVGSDMAIALRYGKVASNRLRPDSVNPLNNFFLTSDGRWLCLRPRQGGDDWPRIARAAGRADLIEDPRFSSTKHRRKNGPELVGELDRGFAALTLEAARAALDRADVIWSLVQTPQEVIADPQAEAAGCFVRMEGADGAEILSPAAPVRFHGYEEGVRPAAPTYGQHSKAIARELGLGEAEIQALVDRRILNG